MFLSQLQKFLIYCNLLQKSIFSLAMHHNDHPSMPPSPTLSKQSTEDKNKVKHLPAINSVKQNADVKQKEQKDQHKQVQQSELEARLKQLDQYKQIHQQNNPDTNSPQHQNEIEKDKIREVRGAAVTMISLLID